MKKLILINFLLITGCDNIQLFGGVAFQDSDYTAESWSHENPIGRFGLEVEKHLINEFYSRGHCTHSSSIGVIDNPGQNICGADLIYKLEL